MQFGHVVKKAHSLTNEVFKNLHISNSRELVKNNNGSKNNGLLQTTTNLHHLYTRPSTATIMHTKPSLISSTSLSPSNPISSSSVTAESAAPSQLSPFIVKPKISHTTTTYTQNQTSLDSWRLCHQLPFKPMTFMFDNVILCFILNLDVIKIGSGRINGHFNGER